MENVWLWTADHDIEDPSLTQITVYAGRGIYSESTSGNIWMLGTAVEHHVSYQYQFASTKNVFAGQIQTETAYYQPNPNAKQPFPIVAGFNDPNFDTSCAGLSGNCAAGWGLRVINSSSVLIYGAGLYSFFSNYSTSMPHIPLPRIYVDLLIGYEQHAPMPATVKRANCASSASKVAVVRTSMCTTSTPLVLHRWSHGTEKVWRVMPTISMCSRIRLPFSGVIDVL